MGSNTHIIIVAKKRHILGTIFLTSDVGATASLCIIKNDVCCGYNFCFGCCFIILVDDDAILFCDTDDDDDVWNKCGRDVIFWKEGVIDKNKIKHC
jgi:hypothetical protein